MSSDSSPTFRSVFLSRPLPPPESPGGLAASSSESDTESKDKRKSISKSPDSVYSVIKRQTKTTKPKSRKRSIASPPASLLRDLNLNYQHSESPPKRPKTDGVVASSSSSSSYSSGRLTNPELPKEQEGEGSGGKDDTQPVEEEVPCALDDGQDMSWTEARYSKNSCYCYLCKYALTNASATAEATEVMLSKLFLYTFRDSGQDRAESNVQDKYDRDFRDIKQLDPTLPPTRLEDWKKPCIMAHFMLHNQNKEIFDEWKRRQLSFLLIQEVTGGICQKNIFTGTKTLNLKHTDTFLKLCKMHDSYSSGGSSSSSSSSSRK